jgi:hypothetical protein
MGRPHAAGWLRGLPTSIDPAVYLPNILATAPPPPEEEPTDFAALNAGSFGRLGNSLYTAGSSFRLRLDPAVLMGTAGSSFRDRFGAGTRPATTERRDGESRTHRAIPDSWMHDSHASATDGAAAGTSGGAASPTHASSSSAAATAAAEASRASPASGAGTGRGRASTPLARTPVSKWSSSRAAAATPSPRTGATAPRAAEPVLLD